MTMMLRAVLIVGSLLTTALIIRKIRQSKVQIEDSVFWVFVSAILIIFSIFPKTADILSRLAGTYSTSNFIFLFIIFLLLVKVFSLTLRVSQLESKQRELVQRIALNEKEREEKQDEKPERESGLFSEIFPGGFWESFLWLLWAPGT